MNMIQSAIVVATCSYPVHASLVSWSSTSFPSSTRKYIAAPPLLATPKLLHIHVTVVLSHHCYLTAYMTI